MDLLALLGNPVEQSLSPQIHQHFATQYGISLEYHKILVPLNEFKKYAAALIEKNYLGFNITAPFKKEAFEWVNECTDRAKQAESINTVIHKNGKVWGDNTDGVGFINDLSQKKIIVKNQTIIFAGAGGAAQGILPPLLEQKPARVVMINRDPQKLNYLQKRYGIETAHWNDLPSLLWKAHLLIDATSEKTILQETLKKFSSPKTLKIYDLKYRYPEPTPLIQWATQEGYEAYDGLGMLIEQAAEAFYDWFKKKPDAKRLVLRQNDML